MEWEVVKNNPKVTIKETYINIPSAILKKINSNTIQALYNGKEIAIKECSEKELHRIQIYKNKYQARITNKELIQKMIEYGYEYKTYEIEETKNGEETIYIIKK